MAKVELDIRAQIANLNKGLNKTQKELKELQTQSTKTSKTIQNNMDKSAQSANQLKSALTGVFAIGTAVQLGRAIVNTRAEFEKFEAMLKVALGTAEAANREFSKIQQFAAQTPFSVRELTESFVKLVNQGFKPTQREMRAMGDLAAAMGKDFVQLTEAIIDAQVGEFERLKEFGIRASKQGDEVSLAFKGVEHQVDFTAEAIQNAIIGFGEMDGVMGTMEEISQTLGGQLSNLGDSFDTLANQVGKMSSDEVGAGITVLRNLTDITTTLLEAAEQEKEREGFVGFLEKVNKGIGDWLLPLISPVHQLSTGLEVLADWTTDASEGLTDLIIADEDLGDEAEETNDKIIVQIESIEALQKRVKKLNEEKKTLSVTDTVRIAEINRETAAIKAQIDELNKLGVSQKLKDVSVSEDDERKMQMDLDKEYYDFIKEEEKERAKTAEETDKKIFESLQIRLKDQFAIEEAAQQARLDSVNASFEILKAFTSENAEAQQAISIAQAIINGAVGITKTGAELGYPAAIPFQIALGLQTLAQIATIRAQKFEGGHYEVLGGRRHAQGGVDIGIGEAEQGEGIAVFSRQATQKYGKFLPAFVKAMNENDATVTGYGDAAYNISLDDSRQVSKLEAIRELLAQPEVRIEGKYKIVTRNGHRQRIKL